MELPSHSGCPVSTSSSHDCSPHAPSSRAHAVHTHRCFLAFGRRGVDFCRPCVPIVVCFIVLKVSIECNSMRLCCRYFQLLVCRCRSLDVEIPPLWRSLALGVALWFCLQPVLLLRVSGPFPRACIYNKVYNQNEGNGDGILRMPSPIPLSLCDQCFFPGHT